MKHIFFSKMISFLAYFVLVTGLAGCSESDDLGGGGGDIKGKTIKLQKLDFSVAKYLTLLDGTRAADSEEVGLFKIDENGNMTTVVLSCTEEGDGTVTKTRTDIKVIPSRVYSLCGMYTYMEDCNFTTNEGQHIWMKQYYEPDARNFNILVRNGDGAIFYVPQLLVDSYFYNSMFNDAATDKNGNLYLYGSNSALGMLSTQNGQLVMKQINPNGVTYNFGGIIPFDNGTVMTSQFQFCLTCTFFYPNGGFENYFGYTVLERFDDGGYSDETILPVSKVSSGLKTMMVKKTYHENIKCSEYVVSLHDFHVGTSYGEHTLSAPLASYSSGLDYSLDDNDSNYLKWIAEYRSDQYSMNGIFETQNRYFIGRLFVVDKQTMEMRPLEGNEANIIFPNEANMYHGRAWEIYKYDDCWTAKWYDIDALQSGMNSINLPTNFQENSSIVDIPSGKLIVSGIRYADGKCVTYFIDIETGQYTCTETDSERPVTALIPQN